MSLAELPSEDLETCLRVLQRVSEDPALIDDHERFKALIAKIHRLGRKGDRRESGARKREEDAVTRSQTALVQAQQAGESLAAIPDASEESYSAEGTRLHRPVSCYICKRPFYRVHFFYHLLCPTCAAQNYEKRGQRADLTGRVALLTGGRIKIGYQTALRLLRDGARVLVSTRFPQNAAQRFAAESDFGQWQERLVLHRLDLRNIPAVEAFAERLCATEPHLDIVIHNAAQTLKRPPAFYAHLLAGEQEPLPAPVRALLASGGSDVAPLQEAGMLLTGSEMAHYFPPGLLDADGQQIDRRPENSWSQKLGEVDTLEMLEVQLVNAVAPFVLNGRLRSLLHCSPFSRRFIVNVSAMEGQFGRESKTACHPHTNMAKAALNMMTRTSAQDYREDGIYMNSVDTGWITDENPWDKKNRLRAEQSFFTPLDVVDGMARIYDPIARGVTETEEPLWGQFLKDYAPHPW